MDYETAKKRGRGIIPGKRRGIPSEIEEDLELDYKLICQIVDELKREGPPGGALMECYEVGDSVRGYRIRAEARKVSDPRVVSEDWKTQILTCYTD